MHQPPTKSEVRIGDTLSVSALIGRVTLTFDFLTSNLRRVQTTTDLAGSLPCFNPCGAILSYTLWSAPTGTKILSDH